MGTFQLEDLENLYTLLECCSKIDELNAKIKITDKDAIFDAHFPDFPLLPAFIQIDIAVSILKKNEIYINITSIENAKFKEKIIPGDIVEYIIKLNDDNNVIKITIQKDNKIAMRLIGTFEYNGKK